MTRHQKISFQKSAIRIIGYLLLMAAFPRNGMIACAGVALITSEILGIAEEIGEP